MTNEEKARELVPCVTGYGSNYDAIQAREIAVDMAKWKDQQFKDYLINKGGDYEIEDITNPGICEKANVINEILNDLFPSMNDDNMDIIDVLSRED